MDFVALDVETTNRHRSSICEIGLVVFRNGQIVEEWTTLTNPNQAFDAFIMSIHGLSKSDILGAPTFADVAKDLIDRLDGPVLQWGTFDRSALLQAAGVHRLALPSIQWLDGSRYAKQALPGLPRHRLATVCDHLGIDIGRHHRALDDARAAGRAFVELLDRSGVDPASLLQSTQAGIPPRPSHEPPAPGKAPELARDAMVFTGTLDRVRKEVEALARAAGFKVKTDVSSRTAYLVVGRGHEKKRKYREVVRQIADGHDIQILDSAQFDALMEKRIPPGRGPLFENELPTHPPDRALAILEHLTTAFRLNTPTLNAHLTDFPSRMHDSKARRVETDWYFAPHDGFKAALGIMRTGQGASFDIRTGSVFYDHPDGYAVGGTEWRRIVQVESATEVRQGDRPEDRDRGTIVFRVYRRRGVGHELTQGPRWITDQDAFVRFLIEGPSQAWGDVRSFLADGV